MSVASIAEDVQQAAFDGRERFRHAILAAVADDTAIIGTVGMLARGFGVTASEFKSGLRELLEAREIVVYSEKGNRLTIRRERRSSTYLAPLPPACERRRRPCSDLWIV